MRYFKIIFLLCTSLVFCACDDAEVFTETLPVITFGNDTVHVYENTSSVKIPVNLSVPAVRDLVLRVGVKAESNVKENTDYAITSKNITVTKGSKEAVIEFTVKDDQIVNQMRWAEMQILPESSYALQKDENTCRIIILDDESDALISFGETETTGWENDGVLKIPVDIEGTLHNDVKIKLELKSGAPDAGEKYFDLPAEITIPAGETSYEIAIPVTNDNVVNDDRTFVIKMAGVDKGVIKTEKSSCVVTVRNEDAEIFFDGEKEYLAYQENDVVRIPVKIKGYMEGDIQARVKIISYPGGAVENTHFRLKSSEITIDKSTMSGEVLIEVLGKVGVDERPLGLEISEVLAGNTVIREDDTRSVMIYNGAYCKLLGDWEIKCDEPSNINNPCIVTVSMDQFKKSYVCKAAIRTGWEYIHTWHMKYDDATEAVSVVLLEEMLADPHVVFRLWSAANQEFVTTEWNGDNLLNWNVGGDFLCGMADDGGAYWWFATNVRMERVK